MAPSGKTSFPPPTDAAALGFSGLLRIAMEHGLGKWPTSPGIAESWTRKELAQGIEKALRRKARGEVDDKFGMVKSWLDDGRVPRAENLSALVLTLTDGERIAHATQWREAFLAARRRPPRQRADVPPTRPDARPPLPHLDTDDCPRSLHDCVLRLLGVAPRLQDWPDLSRPALLSGLEAKRFPLPELRELQAPRTLLLRLLMRAVRGALMELSLGDPGAVQDRRSLFDLWPQARLMPLLAPMAATAGPDLLTTPQGQHWAALSDGLAAAPCADPGLHLLPDLIAQACAREWARYPQVYWTALSPIWDGQDDRDGIEARLALRHAQGRTALALMRPLQGDPSPLPPTLTDLALDLPCADGGRVNAHLDAFLSAGWGGTTPQDRLFLLGGDMGTGKTGTLHLLAHRLHLARDAQDLAVLPLTLGPDGQPCLPACPDHLAKLDPLVLARRAGCARALILIDDLDIADGPTLDRLMQTLDGAQTRLGAVPCKFILACRPDPLDVIARHMGHAVPRARISGLSDGHATDLRPDWLARYARFTGRDGAALTALAHLLADLSHVPFLLARIVHSQATLADRASLLDDLIDLIGQRSSCVQPNAKDEERPARNRNRTGFPSIENHLAARRLLAGLTGDAPADWLAFAREHPHGPGLALALRDLRQGQPGPAPGIRAHMIDSLGTAPIPALQSLLPLALTLEASDPDPACATGLTALLPFLPLADTACTRALLALVLGDRAWGTLRLVGQDLAGLQIDNARLGGALLDRVRLDEAVLAGCDGAGAQIAATSLRSARITGCRDLEFDRCDLSGAELMDCQFAHGGWSRSDLRGARLGRSRFANVLFDGCDLSGAVLTDTTFLQCRFLNCTWDGADLSRCRFEKCDDQNLKPFQALA